MWMDVCRCIWMDMGIGLYVWMWVGVGYWVLPDLDGCANRPVGVDI